MGRIRYSSLAKYLESAGPLEVEERGDRIEVSLLTPTLSDAMGVQGAGDERGIYRLVFEKRGDEAELVDAWVEIGGERRRIAVADLEAWLAFLDAW